MYIIVVESDGLPQVFNYATERKATEAFKRLSTLKQIRVSMFDLIPHETECRLIMAEDNRP